MEIRRIVNGEEITIKLTQQELYLAQEEFTKTFMQNELISSFGYSESDAANLAQEAYDRYANGDGETEYECIEAVVSAFENDSVER